MKEDRVEILENCLDEIQEAYSILEDVKYEEEEAYDNMPEGLQYSERGDQMQEAIDSLENALGDMDCLIQYMEDVISYANNPDILEVEPWERLKVGDSVTHKSFGIGTVTSIEGNHMCVSFKEKTALFIFPDAIIKGHIIIQLRMNNNRRKRIKKSILILTEVQSKLQDVQKKELASLNQLSEDDENRETMEDLLSSLEDALGELDNILDTLTSGDF